MTRKIEELSHGQYYNFFLAVDVCFGLRHCAGYPILEDLRQNWPIEVDAARAAYSHHWLVRSMVYRVLALAQSRRNTKYLGGEVRKQIELLLIVGPDASGRRQSKPSGWPRSAKRALSNHPCGWHVLNSKKAYCVNRFWIKNFGCRASQADGAAIEAGLTAKGLAAVDGAAAADLVVLNTCTV